MQTTSHRAPTIKHFEVDSWVVDHSNSKHPIIQANIMTKWDRTGYDYEVYDGVKGKGSKMGEWDGWVWWGR